MKRLLSVLVVAFAVSNMSAQPLINWEQVYGGTANDQVNGTTPVSGGGLVMAGESCSTDGDVLTNLGFADAWIFKINEAGELLWQESFGGSGHDVANAIIESPDGSFVFAGTSSSSDGDVNAVNGDLDVWVARLNADGELDWSVAMGGSDVDIAHSIANTPDNGFIVAGETYSSDGDVTNNYGNRDCWIVKLSATGALEWQQTYGGEEDDAARDIVPTYDGGYLVCADTRSLVDTDTGMLGESDCWILKLDSYGEIQWQHVYGGSSSDECAQVAIHDNGNYIMTGSTLSTDGDVSFNHGLSDYWIVCLNPEGNVLWEKTLGGSFDDAPTSMGIMPEGYLMIAGYSSSDDGDITDHTGLPNVYDYWVIKLEEDGDLVWSRSLGGTGMDLAADIVMDGLGQVVVAGRSFSGDGDISEHYGETSSADCWIVSLHDETNHVTAPQQRDDITLCPNPSHGHILLHSSASLQHALFRIMNMSGQEVLRQSGMNAQSPGIDLSHLPAGVYLLEITENDYTYCKRLVLV